MEHFGSGLHLGKGTGTLSRGMSIGEYIVGLYKTTLVHSFPSIETEQAHLHTSPYSVRYKLQYNTLVVLHYLVKMVPTLLLFLLSSSFPGLRTPIVYTP